MTNNKLSEKTLTTLKPLEEKLLKSVRTVRLKKPYKLQQRFRRCLVLIVGILGSYGLSFGHSNPAWILDVWRMRKGDLSESESLLEFERACI